MKRLIYILPVLFCVAAFGAGSGQKAGPANGCIGGYDGGYDYLPPDQDICTMASRLYYPGAFEIYALPKPGNMLVDKKAGNNDWISHFDSCGQGTVSHSGTDHNLPYGYDSHIPLLIWEPECENWVNCDKDGKARHENDEYVSLKDVVPTLAAIMRTSPPSRAQGRILEKAFKIPISKVSFRPPKAVLVLVMDQGSWHTLKGREKHWPKLKKLHDTGFLFRDAYVDYGAAGTAASHAVIGTGTYPSLNGVFDNDPYLPAVNGTLEIYSEFLEPREDKNAVDPKQLRQPTLADLWSVATCNDAVIMSYSSASRAALGMAGHGSAYKGRYKTCSCSGKTETFWFDYEKKQFQTDERWFKLPADFIKDKLKFDAEKLSNRKESAWANQKCLFEGKPYDKCLMGSPAFVEFEGMALEKAVAAHEQEIQNGHTALIMVSFKGLDYCGHFLGLDSKECLETMEAVDARLGLLVERVNKITKGEMVAVMLADHGSAPLPAKSGGVQILREKLKEDINRHFCKSEPWLKPVKAVKNSVINIDLKELERCIPDAGEVGKKVAEYLMDYPGDGGRFFKTVLTYKEIEERCDSGSGQVDGGRD